jgi:glycosyltransferase involved in cell wall biosynthesis
MAQLQGLWTGFIANTDLEGTRPGFRFDPNFYAAQHPNLHAERVDLAKHYQTYGKVKNSPPNLYQRTARSTPDLDARIAALIIDPDLSALIAAGEDGACELAFELLALGSPLDGQISDFSEDYYLAIYPNIAKARIAPVLHFILHGLKEGRRSLKEVRANQYEGAIPFDPEKPTCMICAHEFSRTGAPVVGLALVQEARQSHNVVVTGLRGGTLLEQFIEASCLVILSDNLSEDMPYFQHPALQAISFAILNSVDCFRFTKAMVRMRIPFASYLHEYADYILPPFKATDMALYSDLLVFSSSLVRDSWKNLLDDLDFDIARDSRIIAQQHLRRGGVSASTHRAARDRLARLIGCDLKGKRVVIGAGHAQWRKGTDLFVMTAQAMQKVDRKTVFIWIGDGLNHTEGHFGVWLDKHMREAGANTPGGNLHFLPAGDYYQDVLRASDVLFLSSRLDPLPNVVFDTMRVGSSVVRFRGASGFDDEIYATQAGLHDVAYGDIQAAAQALKSVSLKRPVKDSAPDPEADQQAPDLFAPISQALHTRLGEQPHFVIGPGDYDMPVIFSTAKKDATSRVYEREKIWTYGRRRVWQSQAAAQTEIAASDHWFHRGMEISDYSARDSEKPAPAFSMHVHVFHTDDLERDLGKYAIYRQAGRIVATTDTPQKADTISAIFTNARLTAEVLVGPNVGRDILPFMKLFADGPAARDPDDALWCHVHQKKAATSAIAGDVWRAFLMTILLGDSTETSCALDLIAETNTGLIGAFDPYAISWAGSRRLLQRIEPQLPGPLPMHPILFPTGNMFWTKAGVVARMNTLFGLDYPWPNEPIPDDGTVLHLIERLWPGVAAIDDMRAVFLDKPDQPRN